MTSTKEKAGLLQDPQLQYGSDEIELQNTPTDYQELQLPPKSQRITSYVIGASFMAALGGVLFGYDVGIISGALLQLKVAFSLNCFQREMVVSSMLIGAVVSSIFGGFIIDYWGRRRTIILNSIVFIIGAIILVISPSFLSLVVGRFILGLAVSLSAIGECIYISEIAPANKRGLLVTFNELGITVGLLLAYVVNYGFINKTDGWKYMFGLSMIPAVVQGIGMFFLPSSPRFLLLQKKDQEAEVVLQKLRGESDVSAELKTMKLGITIEQNHGVCDLFSSTDNMRGRMFIGAGLVFLAQFSGQPNVLYYAPTIYQSLGFESNLAATLATVGLGIVKFIATVVSLSLFDKAGRRKFLLSGSTLMALSIFILGIVTFTLQQVEDVSVICHDGVTMIPVNRTIGSNISLEESAPVLEPHQDQMQSVISKWISFIALLVFVAGYAFSFGPGVWLILSEIFPSTIKGRAISLVTIFNWGTNLIISLTFLHVMNGLGVSVTFLLYSMICAIAVVFIFLLVPETKNRTLEQISADLNKGSLLERLMQYRCWCLKQHNIRVEHNYQPVINDPLSSHVL
ncbi:solute carrier family 2, facilitated glucose transporter member 10-like isoform X2 [Tubulanus polymorphus]|uniref:solute carrier family 2, facilitated glucose transporter member 10-like isoform X2 n=1 Tax=Tubulanus polymorphus TaxID=672921 RepID=UPI003DA48F81